MRAGLAESLSSRDAATAATYLFALWYYWLERGFGHEALTAAEAWLAIDRESLDPITRYSGVFGAGDDPDVHRRRARGSSGHGRAGGDRAGTSWRVASWMA